jgi:hypothetical protein
MLDGGILFELRLIHQMACGAFQDHTSDPEEPLER